MINYRSRVNEELKTPNLDEMTQTCHIITFIVKLCVPTNISVKARELKLGSFLSISGLQTTDVDIKAVENSRQSDFVGFKFCQSF